MPLKQDELRVKFTPRKIDLEPRDLSKLSCLAEGEIVEDPLGRHAPGAKFVISHGQIGSVKFPKLIFPAVNPIEFFLFSTRQSLESIRVIEKDVLKNHNRINFLLLEEFQYCISSVAAIEAVINQTIPGDFEYVKKKKKIAKNEIEKYWKLEDKIKKVIPKITGVAVAGDSRIWKPLIELIALRNDLIHLKTTYPVISDFQSYQDLYRRLLDHDYESSYKAVKDVIRVINEAGHKLYAEQKAATEEVGKNKSWVDILKSGLRRLTG